ncbi:YdcH family protein [Hirschia baltica]|uniref:DUF465 domain-containing protein n=1 Tax=Hirschia baltica (strain ATCC 49814 / DSM 5838 / IFAM 1418) TaxID=582402 RepID=C6XRM2_HIRBI|nr:DUF465 domain-containing protein [Hirschia baltica]ACT60632.1 conserved hypothetical protein [Hirschia baltica ATCC 49814]
MSTDARIRELSERHKRLETVLEDKRKHPSTTDQEMLDLKQKKLRIKDEIISLKSA